MNEAERFWSNVDKSGGENACWPWKGWLEWNGYARFMTQGRRIGAHCFALELTLERSLRKFAENGERICVLHSCDNRSCCNPRHLREGTYSDNQLDAKNKGRFTQGFQAGEKHPLHKLTSENVQEIRKVYALGIYTQKRLAMKFHVGQQEISRIINYRRRSNG